MAELHPDKGLLSVGEFKRIFIDNYRWIYRLTNFAVNKASDVEIKMAAIMDRHGFKVQCPKHIKILNKNYALSQCWFLWFVCMCMHLHWYICMCMLLVCMDMYSMH